MQKLKVGDTVQVMAGAEVSAATKRGKVLSINRDAKRLSVEGLRLVKKHVRRGKDPKNPEGGIITFPGTIALASVMVVCGKCDKATRVGIRVQGEKKVRFCKKCDAAID